MYVKHANKCLVKKKKKEKKRQRETEKELSVEYVRYIMYKLARVRVHEESVVSIKWGEIRLSSLLGSHLWYPWMVRFWTARDRCHDTRSPSTDFYSEPARHSSRTSSGFDEGNGRSWCGATMRAVGSVPGARALGLRLRGRCRPVPEDKDTSYFSNWTLQVHFQALTDLSFHLTTRF